MPIGSIFEEQELLEDDEDIQYLTKEIEQTLHVSDWTIGDFDIYNLLDNFRKEHPELESEENMLGVKRCFIALLLLDSYIHKYDNEKYGKNKEIQLTGYGFADSYELTVQYMIKNVNYIEINLSILTSDIAAMNSVDTPLMDTEALARLSFRDNEVVGGARGFKLSFKTLPKDIKNALSWLYEMPF